MESSGRLAFADVLRGVASLSVVIGHFTVLYLTAPDLVATITAGAPSGAVALPRWLNSAVVTINPPSTGVAIFFLISGFVIPLSLETSSIRSYLLKRVFRIYPTLWLALALAALAIFVSSTIWSRPTHLEAADYAANSALLANMFTRFDILTVAWTLQIEIKFYLLAILIYACVSRRVTIPLFLFGAVLVANFWFASKGCDNVRIACWDHYRMTTKRLLWEAMFFTYMMIGSFFYAHYHGRIGAKQALAGVLFLFACFEVALDWSPLPMLNEGDHLPYLWGLLIFGGCYLTRNKVRLTPPLKFLADISYPLYLVHPIVGYVAIRLLEAAGIPFWPAFAVALALVIGLAVLVHRFVEAPAIAYSKTLAKSWDAKNRRDRAVASAAPGV